MQSPTAVPRMPASASGVSTQRSAPKRSRSPAVARKTPPARPTSSPITSTSGRAPARRGSASFTASTSVQLTHRGSSAAPRGRRERGGGSRSACSKTSPRSAGGSASASAIPSRISLERLVADRLGQLVVEQPAPAQVALVAADALALPLLLDPLRVDVARRIVGGRVRRGAVGDRLDERRPFAGARPRDRLARRLVDGEHVAAVDAHAGHAVADGLVRERLRARSAPRAASRSPTGCCCRRGRAAPASPRRSSRPRGTRPPTSRRRRRTRSRTRRSPRSFLPHASPAACGTCVAIGTQIEATL